MSWRFDVYRPLVCVFICFPLNSILCHSCGVHRGVLFISDIHPRLHFTISNCLAALIDGIWTFLEDGLSRSSGISREVKQSRQMWAHYGLGSQVCNHFATHSRQSTICYSTCSDISIGRPHRYRIVLEAHICTRRPCVPSREAATSCISNISCRLVDSHSSHHSSQVLYHPQPPRRFAFVP